MSNKVAKPSVIRHIALCYVRLSYNPSNNMNQTSPDRQRQNCLDLCREKGWTPLFFEDTDGHNSGTKTNNRAEWKNLESRMKSPDVVAVVANDLSRFHRNLLNTLKLLEESGEAQFELWVAATKRQIKADDFASYATAVFEGMGNELYAREISRKVKDSVDYRRARGISSGRPPAGTKRGEDKYLKPSNEGAWLMPDGSFVPGKEGDKPPSENAVWRGYYQCAERILRAYAIENRGGSQKIALLMRREGWPFRTDDGLPRRIQKDDTRRVIDAWPDYMGMVVGSRAKDRAEFFASFDYDSLTDTGRSVFPFELLIAVAMRFKERGTTAPRAGTHRKAKAYGLSQILYCAHCDRQALEHNDPTLRGRLQGWNQNERLRYRHTSERSCGCQNLSVSLTYVEDEVGRLISLFALKPEHIPLLTEISTRTAFVGKDDSDTEFEQQKTRELARLKKSLENNLYLFRSGEIDQREYSRSKADAERQISYWESRTTETEKLGLELAACIRAISNLATVWMNGEDEERQALAQNVFEYIVFDLDEQQITDFRLKPWADRFLVLSAELHKKDDDSGNKNPVTDGVSRDVLSDAPMGLSRRTRTHDQRCFSLLCLSALRRASDALAA